jgi:hypothetical protein
MHRCGPVRRLQRSGVAETTIDRLGNARYEAPFSSVLKLAEALGVEPQALMEPWSAQ